MSESRKGRLVAAPNGVSSACSGPSLENEEKWRGAWHSR